MKALFLAAGALTALLLASPVKVETVAGGGAPSWPVSGAALSQPYGCTAFELEPAAAFCPSGHFHAGIDLAAPLGTSVRAADAGLVEVVHSVDGYGLHVMLQHSPRLLTLYG